jgi:HEAT repeat protein
MRGISADSARRIAGHIERLRKGDADEVARAEARLIHFGWKAVDALIEASVDPDPEVRCHAVWALGKIGDARAFDTVVRATSDGDEDVVYDAILALGHLGDDRAVPLLEGPLLHHDNEVLRGCAAEALALLGPRGAEALRRAARDPEPGIRALAAWGLATVRATDPGAILPILAELSEDEATEVRVGAIEALGGLSDDRALEILRNLAPHSTGRERNLVDYYLAFPGCRRSLGG